MNFIKVQLFISATCKNSLFKYKLTLFSYFSLLNIIFLNLFNYFLGIHLIKIFIIFHFVQQTASSLRGQQLNIVMLKMAVYLYHQDPTVSINFFHILIQMTLLLLTNFIMEYTCVEFNLENNKKIKTVDFQ